MSTDLKNLFTYRIVVNDIEVFMLPNRRRVAKKINSLLRQGHKVSAIKAQHKVNNVFVDDALAYEAAKKLAAKKVDSTNETTSSVSITSKKLASKLAQAAKLAAQADEISEEHIEAIQALYNDFINAYEAE